MPDYYKQIPGWFHCSKLYDNVVESFKDATLFVEIGSYFGKSSCYMAELLKEKNRSTQFHMIDPWEWDNNYKYYDELVCKDINVYDKIDSLKEEHIKVVKEVGKDPFKIVQYYFNKFDILNNVTFVKNKSIDVVNNYKDESIDFLYIDGDHSYEAVKNDIILYLPKIKKGGIISGDDYRSYESVKKAVDELLGNINLSSYQTWWKNVI
jgi:hypothetical protein